MHHKYSSLSDVWSFGIGTMQRAIKPLLTLFFYNKNYSVV